MLDFFLFMCYAFFRIRKEVQFLTIMNFLQKLDFLISKYGLNKNKLRDDFSFKDNLISVYMEFKKLFRNNRLKVKINNNYYKIIGKLGMYHAIIDITNSNNINIGDEVELDITPLQTNDIIRREYI